MSLRVSALLAGLVLSFLALPVAAQTVQQMCEKLRPIVQGTCGDDVVAFCSSYASFASQKVADDAKLKPLTAGYDRMTNKKNGWLGFLAPGANAKIDCELQLPQIWKGWAELMRAANIANVDGLPKSFVAVRALMKEPIPLTADEIKMLTPKQVPQLANSQLARAWPRLSPQQKSELTKDRMNTLSPDQKKMVGM